MRWKTILLLLTLAAVCYGDLGDDIPSGMFTKNSDGHLQFTVEDYPATTIIHLHYNINKPLPGVSASDFNVDIQHKGSDGIWTYVNDKVAVKAGDTIYYWVLFQTTHGGFQKTDLSSIIRAPSTVRTTKTTTPHTTPTTHHHSTKTTHPGPKHKTTTNKPITTKTTPHNPHSHTTSKPPKPDQCTSYPCVIFEDEFDTLDMKKWQHELTASGEGNWEFEMYVNNRSNSWVNDSKLHIRPTLTADVYGEAFLSSGMLDIWGNTPASVCTSNADYGCFRQGTGTNYLNPLQSARLRTVHSFNFKYGRVEAEAKLPKGDWLWPAIWMLPREEHYGMWPASGEIDIVESRGNLNYKDEKGQPFGKEWMASTLHWGPYFAQNQFKRTQATKIATDGDYSSAFHKYAVEWDDKAITFFIDGVQTLKVDPGEGGFWKYGEFEKSDPKMFDPWGSDGDHMAPFDREFYLLVNVAVGGTGGFFPDSAVNGAYPKPWHDKSETAARDFWHAKNQWYPTWKFPDDTLQVNYIRVTKLRPDN